MLKAVGDWLLLNLAPQLAALIVRCIYLTQRVEIVGEENLQLPWKQGERFIFCFWHDQLLEMIKGYRGPGIRILISASKDGELITRVMRCFGHDAVRGSSSRGGRAAVRQMLHLAAQPFDLAFTPDGPRGPRHELKPGVAQVALATRRGVVPTAFVCSRGFRFGSWDRFLLPYPFSRVVWSFAAPLYAADGENVEGFSLRVKEAMEMTQRQAESCLENHGVSAV